jgi:hypothetical protein
MTKHQVALLSTSLLSDSFIFQFGMKKKHILIPRLHFVIVYYLKYINTHDVIIQ